MKEHEMVRRFMIFAVCAMALSLAPASAHECVDVTTRNSAALAFADVTITMHENQPNHVCDEGVSQGAFDRRLTITVAGVVVCDRTTDIDPSFDPFFLGAGLHPDPSIDCGAKFSLIGLTSVATPDPSTIAVDPAGPSARAGLTKRGITETPGSLWYGSTTREIPQDSEGTITRGAGVSR
jgi:hypothetical protein